MKHERAEQLRVFWVEFLRGFAPMKHERAEQSNGPSSPGHANKLERRVAFARSFTVVAALILGAVGYGGWANHRIQTDFPAVTHGFVATSLATLDKGGITIDFGKRGKASTEDCDFIVDGTLYSGRGRSDFPVRNKELFVRYNPANPELNYIREADVSPPRWYFIGGGAFFTLIALLWLVSRRWIAGIACLILLVGTTGTGAGIAGWVSDRRISRFTEGREQMRSIMAEMKARDKFAYDEHVAGEKFMRGERLKELQQLEKQRGARNPN